MAWTFLSEPHDVVQEGYTTLNSRYAAPVTGIENRSSGLPEQAFDVAAYLISGVATWVSVLTAG